MGRDFEGTDELGPVGDPDRPVGATTAHYGKEKAALLRTQGDRDEWVLSTQYVEIEEAR